MARVRTRVSDRMRGAAVAAVACAALSLGGCSSSHFPRAASAGAPATPPLTPDQARVVRAVSVTHAALTARIALSIGVQGIDPSGGNVSVAGQGSVDLATGASIVQFTASVPGVPSAEVTEERVVDGVVYLRSSPASKWAKIDLRSVLTGRTAGLSAQTDPAQALAYLAAVSDDVRPVGPDIVRGAATSRYHATLDLARALARSGISQPVRDRLALLEGRFGAARIPLDVWLDPSGRARRIVLTLQLAPLLSSRAAAAVSTGATVGIQEDLFDFGTPVQVTAPPAADVGPAAPGFGLGLLGA